MFQKSLVGWIVVVLLAGPALAQEEDPDYVPEELEDTTLQESAEAETGWSYMLRIFTSGALGSSKRVIGNNDGNTWTLGFGVDAGVDFYDGSHEWRNLFGLAETFTRTPVIDEFVKSADQIFLESMYLFHLPTAPWFGPFVRFEFNTAIFKGVDVRATEETYSIARAAGPELLLADRLPLTDSFNPLTLRESVGVFIAPTMTDAFEFQVLVGFGARETFADDQLAVLDDEDTDEIEVVELASFNQAGSEFNLSFWGVFDEGRLGYRTEADFMTPFINDLAADDGRSAVELTNIEVSAGISVALVEWASLEYEFRALRSPQLLDEYQLSHSLLLSLGYTLFQSAPAE